MTLQLMGLVDLDKLELMTRFPEIPAYHPELDDEPVGTPVQFCRNPAENVEILATARLPGKLARIVILPDGGWLIGGARTGWAYARGDTLVHAERDIVDVLRDRARVSATQLRRLNADGPLHALYCVVTPKRQFRLVDHRGTEDWEKILRRSPNGPCGLNAWNRRRQLDFTPWPVLEQLSRGWQFPTVDVLGRFDAATLPRTPQDTAEFLREVTKGDKTATGLVLRTADRMTITELSTKKYPLSDATRATPQPMPVHRLTV